MDATSLPAPVSEAVRRGLVIPAVPLALNVHRQFDPRRQRALMRYYVDAGVGGVAVGMHFTQFAIRTPGIDLFEPVLRLCAEEVDRGAARAGRVLAKAAGINGRTPEALQQARLARDLGYHFAVVSMAAFRNAPEQEMVHHMRQVARVMPVFGFYLLTGVGGVRLPYPFWRAIMEIDNLIGIKIASFDRYGTLEVLRAVADSGRRDQVTLYAGNDDSIIYDFITPYRFGPPGLAPTVRVRGGLLGQWACWTRRAVELHARLLGVVDRGDPVTPELLTLSAQVTDANAALFDPAHDYAGSIPGVHEVLRRQGLFEGNWTLDRNEVLSPGQAQEIDRVCAAYPHLTDDDFVRQNLQRWLEG